MKDKQNIILIIGLILLALVLYFGSGNDSRQIKDLEQPAVEVESSNEVVCQVDGLECLFVGCNGFF